MAQAVSPAFGTVEGLFQQPASDLEEYFDPDLVNAARPGGRDLAELRRKLTAGVGGR